MPNRSSDGQSIAILEPALAERLTASDKEYVTTGANLTEIFRGYSITAAGLDFRQRNEQPENGHRAR